MRTKSILFLLCAILPMGAAYGKKSPKPYTIHYEVKLQSASFGDMGTRKLWVKGDKMRWESKSADLPLHIVKNDRGVFLLHPWQDVAAKYPKGTSRGNPRALLPGPTGSPKVFLKAVNAVKHGQETIDNKPCNVYTYTDPVTKRDCRIWIGARSGKPVRLLLKGDRARVDTVTATYTKFVEGANAPDSLFELPKGYTIRPMPARDLTSEDKYNRSKKKLEQLNKNKSS